MPDHAVKHRLGRDAQSVRRARRIVSELIPAADHPMFLDNALLLVSELVGNAVRYGEEPITVDVARDENGLVVGVSDASRRQPALRPRTPAVLDTGGTSDQEEPIGGRGLRLVASLADDWGVEKRQRDKRVWFRLTGQ